MRLLGWLLAAGATLAAQPAKDFQSDFAVEKKNLGVTGNNPYFPLTPGYVLSYRHGKDTDSLTVLNEVKVIDGVQTRVVEDRELKNGVLVELTRDYYSLDSNTNDVYYMGEDVDVYKNGKVVSHEGSWLSGIKGAMFGLMMPGTPRAGHKFYQEKAPGVGMDRAEIISVDDLDLVQDGEGVGVLAVTVGKDVSRREREVRVVAGDAEILLFDREVRLEVLRWLGGKCGHRRQKQHGANQLHRRSIADRPEDLLKGLKCYVFLFFLRVAAIFAFNSLASLDSGTAFMASCARSAKMVSLDGSSSFRFV